MTAWYIALFVLALGAVVSILRDSARRDETQLEAWRRAVMAERHENNPAMRRDGGGV